MRTLREGGKTSFRAIARELGLSAMTVYRVINNSPSVREATRIQVLNALNRYGYYAHKPSGNMQIVFDFTSHEYLQRYGMRLMQRLSLREHSCVVTDHEKNAYRYFEAIAESDVVVFCSAPAEETVRKTREVNPNIYIISIYALCGADITVSCNDFRGGELAAAHLHSLGHRHVAVYLAENNPNGPDRYRGFFAGMHMLDPGCRIDLVYQKGDEDIGRVMDRYYASIREYPTAIFFLAGYHAQMFYHVIYLPNREKYGEISIMGYDRPSDTMIEAMFTAEFDRIEFSPADILDWTEYYIVNHPMMCRKGPIVTQVDVSLKIAGSVKALGNSPENSPITHEFRI